MKMPFNSTNAYIYNEALCRLVQYAGLTDSTVIKMYKRTKNDMNCYTTRTRPGGRKIRIHLQLRNFLEKY